MSRAPANPMRCWAEIDLGALERNLKLIRLSLPRHIRYVAVVKADAYGHGLHQTAARLMHSGADLFGVATVAETAAIRELGPGWPILILGPVLPGEEKLLCDYNATATVSSAAEIERFAAAGRSAGAPVGIHLKIDTGMGRLGAWHTDAPELYRLALKTDGVRLEGIFTHYSAADEDHDFTESQRRLFFQVLRRLRKRPKGIFIHADNSAGLETFARRSPVNAVRVGLLQFGVLPQPGSILAEVRTEPVFSFHARIGLVKTLPAGTGISYGRTHILPRKTRVAVVTCGYADGLPRTCGNRAQVLVAGRRCPVLGRVTMDQTVIDVSAIPDVAPGDLVTLVGNQEGESISLAEFSQWADTIAYESLTSVTKRVPRVYRTSLGM